MPLPLRPLPSRRGVPCRALVAAGACLLLSSCATLAPAPTTAREAAPSRSPSPYHLASYAALSAPDAVRVLDPYLGTRLAALEARSPRLRQTMERLRRGTVELVVATTAQSAGVLRGTSGDRLRPPDHLLGATVTFFDPRSGSVSAVLVHVDVPAAARAARAGGLGDAGRDRLVEEALVHEVWGHAVPLALAGHVGAACADPRPREAAGAACVIRRENELRQELGWTARERYPLTLPLVIDS